MLYDMCSDILLYICTFLDIRCKMSFLSIDKYGSELDTDKYWEFTANEELGEEFWNKAKLRPRRYSNPLNGWKKELVRIEKFQNAIVDFTGKRWENKDFYKFWKYRDRDRRYSI